MSYESIATCGTTRPHDARLEAHGSDAGTDLHGDRSGAGQAPGEFNGEAATADVCRTPAQGFAPPCRDPRAAYGEADVETGISTRTLRRLIGRLIRPPSGGHSPAIVHASPRSQRGHVRVVRKDIRRPPRRLLISNASEEQSQASTAT